MSTSTARPAIRILKWFLLALPLGTLAAMIAGQLQDAWWHAGVLFAAAGVFALCALSATATKWMSRALLVSSLLLSALAILEGLRAIGNYAPYVRVGLFLGSSNLLAHAIALAGTAVVARYPLQVSYLIVPVYLAAIILTGSRTALIAFGIALMLHFALGRNRFYGRVLLIMAAVPVVLAVLAVSAWVTEKSTSETRNLLKYSDALWHRVWNESHAAEISISRVRDKGPRPDGVVHRVAGSSNQEGAYGSLLLTQGVEQSVAGESYVASVYLRADRSQLVEVGTNLSKAVCHVSTQWRRCITPVGTGNGTTWVQFQLGSHEPGQAIDVYVWGAQVERGTQPSAPEHTGVSPIVHFWRQSIMRRFNVVAWPTDKNVRSRLDAYATAWRIFLQHPLAGAGLGSFAEASSRTHVAKPPSNGPHAHNLVLQIAAESGLLGLAAWSIPIAAAGLQLWRGQWRALIALMICVLILNLADVTYFNSALYYPFWAALGMAANDEEGRTRTDVRLAGGRS